MVARKQPLPDWYLDEPPLHRGDDFYLRAFWCLSTCRSFGMNIGPLPWSDVVNYGDRKGLDAVMTDVFVDVMDLLDGHYLEWMKNDGRTVEPKGRARRGKNGHA